MIEVEWAVSKHDAGWKIGHEVAYVVLDSDHPAESFDAQLADWGMNRTQLTRFEPPECRSEFEAIFGPVGPSVASEG